MIVMKQKATITRTDAGATTAVMSSAYEWSKKLHLLGSGAG